MKILYVTLSVNCCRSSLTAAQSMTTADGADSVEPPCAKQPSPASGADTQRVLVFLQESKAELTESNEYKEARNVLDSVKLEG